MLKLSPIYYIIIQSHFNSLFLYYIEMPYAYAGLSYNHTTIQKLKTHHNSAFPPV